ncbi:Pleiotropic drug resistance protein TUR2 [Senna tora]|uniref:Pleiotropic drug resistance protein TUR2 n=1 Tax=Senna tora TaxID=362788 RepID=A0A834SP52_9FABA|nr:Pleiotropic drug resistance protein TUR2 [Senna tora]
MRFKYNELPIDSLLEPLQIRLIVIYIPNNLIEKLLGFLRGKLLKINFMEVSSKPVKEAFTGPLAPKSGKRMVLHYLRMAGNIVKP